MKTKTFRSAENFILQIELSDKEVVAACIRTISELGPGMARRANTNNTAAITPGWGRSFRVTINEQTEA
jgi:hypothetical protein